MSLPTSRSTQGRKPIDWLLPRPFLVLGAIAIVIIATYGASVVLVRISGMVSQVLLPVIIGALVAALLMPVQVFFNHLLRLPRHLAAAITILGTLAVLSGVVYLTGAQIADGLENIRDIIVRGLNQLERWLVEGPLAIGQEEIQELIGEAQSWIQSNTGQLTSGVMTATTGVTNVLIGFLIVTIMCFFFLAEGDRMISMLLLIVSEKHRFKVREGIRRGWVTLGTWARTQVVVSAVDAVGIAIGMWVLGLPFILPLMVLTFILCFIPMLGAWLSGIVVVLTALVFEGSGAALIMAIWVLAVQQLESQLLSPLLMGKAVNVHPLAILLGVTTGTYLMGLTGALLTVPTLACVISMWRYWKGRDPFPGLSAGKSALLDSPRDLVPKTKNTRMPKRVGGVTPDWLLARHDESRRAAEEHTRKLERENAAAGEAPQSETSTQT